MKSFHLLARSVAATAVAGIALIGFSGVAGATTVSVSVPPVLGGTGSSNPILTIGTPNDTASPVPGADASVPAHADARVNPGVATAAVPDPTGQTARLAHLGSVHVKADACIAAVILSGDDPSSCPGAVDGTNPVVGQVSALQDAGTLPRALADVGGCVQVALAANAPVDTCTSSIPSGTLPTGDLGNVGDIGDLGSLPVGDVGSMPTVGTLPDTGVLDTVSNALSSSGLCDLVDQVGLSGLLTCANSSAAPTAPIDTAGNPLGSTPLCLGFAAVIHADTGLCSTHAPAPGTQAHATVKARHDGGATTGDAGANATMNGSCVANVGSTSSSAPFSPATAGGFAGLGLGLASIGKVLRRLRRPLSLTA